MQLIDGKWINWTELLTWGSLITESIADRDVGKSYGMLKRCMVRARKHGEAMVWLRRTDDEAKALCQSWGNSKVKAIAESAHLSLDNFQKRGERILFRLNKDESWRPMIRYGGLSSASAFRDTDDPAEKILFLDEAFATPAKHNRYVGNEVEDCLDIFKSLRKGDCDIRLVLCGNRERHINLWHEYFGIEKEIIEEGTYRIQTSPKKRDRIPADVGNSIVVDVRANHNATHEDLKELFKGTVYGDFLGGSAKGHYKQLVMPIPPTSWHYCSFDFGHYGSIWNAPDRFMIASLRRAGNKTIRLAPDGRRDTVVLNPVLKRRLVYLRSAWNSGKLRFDSAAAAEILLPSIAKLI